MAGDEAAKETTPGTVDMKVTTKKPIGFYIRSAKSFLQGVESESGEKKEPVCVLNILGLGEAINVAVAAATAVEKEGLGKITKVETSYPDMTSGGSTRGCPHIAMAFVGRAACAREVLSARSACAQRRVLSGP
eukprot:CAMPEP_0115749060 /NCGR_PEP_ID=MMETSP0272-20121206/93991_1 /TAXON_ID=71861 /ORGANISM="Scrippsiella trochoidea, Strain CCMP3099" /LENGTH=132 /DNA_ID=CAMNT_0003194087 /DNA_START=83 /DNA_END=481 /DNA_ORIENTATION=-